MKKIISVLLILSMLIAMAVIPAYAADEVTVTVTEKNTWHITGSGVIQRSDLPINGMYGYAHKIILDGDFTGIAGGAFARVTMNEIVLNDGLEYIGNNAFFDSHGFKNIEIPDSVTEIGRGAFSDSGLKSIKLSESLTEIPEGLFQYCNLLESVTIPENVTRIEEQAFYGCKALENVTMGENVEYIGDWAFYNTKWYNSIGWEYYGGKVLLRYDPTKENGGEAVVKEGTKYIYSGAFGSNVTSVIMPDTVTGIGYRLCKDKENTLEKVVLSNGLKELPEDLFVYCTALKEIEIPKGVEYICSSIRYTPWYEALPETAVVNNNLLKCKISENGVATVPAGVKNIMGNIFEYNSYLKRVILPDSIERIGRYAFNGCTALTDINIPKGVKIIDSRAFGNCISLVIDGLNLKKAEHIGSSAFSDTGLMGELKIGENIKNIESYAFSGTDLSSVYIEGSGEELELQYNVFASCEKLQTVHMPGFSAPYENIRCFKNCVNLKSVEIGEGLETVYEEMFYGCSSLEEVILPESVNEILVSAFENCTSLKNINIPQNVSDIGINAFKGCTSLESVVIPTAMNKISESTFMGCTALSSVTLHENINTIDNNAFMDCTSLCEVTLPEGITHIRVSAFENTGLQTLILPDSLEYIRGRAFAGTRISEVTIPTGIKSIYANIFDNIENTVHVYASSEVNGIGSDSFKGKDIVVHTPRDSKAYKAAAMAGADIVLTKEDRIGEVYNSIITTDIITTMNGNEINAYSVNGQTIILVRDLENIGFDVRFDEETRVAYADYNQDKEISPGKAVVLSDNKVMYTDITVEINGVSIGGFNIGGYMAVVAEDMGKYIPDISCTWVQSERALKMLASSDIATIDYFIEEYARINGLEAAETSKYFSDSKSKYTDVLVDKGMILTKDYKGLLYPDSAFTVYLFATYIGRALYAEDKYEYWAYRKTYYTVPEIDYTNIPIYVQSYITRMYEDGIIEPESINGVNTIDTNRVMTKAEVTEMLEKLLVNSQ